MSVVTSHPGDHTPIRAIVFREGDMYVAQCLDIDVAAQAPNVDAALARLDLTLEAEMAECNGCELKDRIAPAPNYYHTLWNESSIKLERVNMPAREGRGVVEAVLAKAA